jgi:hypothetical protein
MAKTDVQGKARTDPLFASEAPKDFNASDTVNFHVDQGSSREKGVFSTTEQ